MIPLAETRVYSYLQRISTAQAGDIFNFSCDKLDFPEYAHLKPSTDLVIYLVESV